MGWELTNDRQIWLQLVDILQRRIVSGQYPAGSRIPSVRDLAAEAGVNPNTMQRALSALEEHGLLSASRNAGRYVTQDEARIAATRQNLAQTELEQFSQRMRQLGYEEEAMKAFITKGENL